MASPLVFILQRRCLHRDILACYWRGPRASSRDSGERLATAISMTHALDCCCEIHPCWMGLMLMPSIPVSHGDD